MIDDLAGTASLDRLLDISEADSLEYLPEICAAESEAADPRTTRMNGRNLSALSIGVIPIDPDACIRCWTAISEEVYALCPFLIRDSEQQTLVYDEACPPQFDPCLPFGFICPLP